MFYTSSSYCSVEGFDDTIMVYYYSWNLLYCAVPHLITYHNPMKPNPFFPFVLLFTPMKPMYIPLPLAGLSLTYVVTNVREAITSSTLPER